MSEPALLPPSALNDWALPSHGLQVETIDAHVGGQGFRMIVKGVPPVRGRTMADRLTYAGKHFDHLRRALLFEPRGHPDLAAALLTPPAHSGSHCGALFLHRGGFSAMCGHGIIALTTILLESGMVDLKAPETRLRIDTPAGTVEAWGMVEKGRVARVVFRNVPSRVLAMDQRIAVPGRGALTYHLIFSGVLLALAEAGDLGVCTGSEGTQAAGVAGGELLRLLAGPVAEAVPGYPLSGLVLRAPPMPREGGRADLRQVTVFADGGLDRSAGALALCAQLALSERRGELGRNEVLTVEGITGSTLQGRMADWDPDPVAGGLVCEVEGQAWITGRHTFLIGTDDPFRSGFLL